MRVLVIYAHPLADSFAAALHGAVVAHQAGPARPGAGGAARRARPAVRARQAAVARPLQHRRRDPGALHRLPRESGTRICPLLSAIRAYSAAGGAAWPTIRPFSA